MINIKTDWNQRDENISTENHWISPNYQGNETLGLNQPETILPLHFKRTLSLQFSNSTLSYRRKAPAAFNSRFNRRQTKRTITQLESHNRPVNSPLGWTLWRKYRPQIHESATLLIGARRASWNYNNEFAEADRPAIPLNLYNMCAPNSISTSQQLEHTCNRRVAQVFARGDLRAISASSRRGDVKQNAHSRILPVSCDVAARW